MRMLNCDSVRGLHFDERLSMCGDSGSPDFSELACENLGIMEGDVFGESSIRRRARRAGQVEFIPVDEISDEDILDPDFFSFDDEEEAIEDINDDSTPYDYDDEEEEDLSFAAAITAPKVEVFINTNPDTGAVSVNTEDEPIDTFDVDSQGDYDSSYDDRMECLGDYDDWTGGAYDDNFDLDDATDECGDIGSSTFREDLFLDEGDPGYDYEYDSFSHPTMPVNPSRKDRIRQRMWKMREEESSFDPFEEMQDEMEEEDVRRFKNRMHSDRSDDRTDGRGRKYITGKMVYPEGERPVRQAPFKSVKLALTLESERVVRAEMIKDWADGRKIFINPHGWMYWCRPTVDRINTLYGETIERIHSSRQGARLTGEEYRFFMSLSRGERNHCLHPKCQWRDMSIWPNFEGGKVVSRSNSWKHQRRQTRQWENPTMRRCGNMEVIQTTPSVEMDTFDRVFYDRIAVLETRIEIEEAKMDPDNDTIRTMRSDLRSLMWEIGCSGERYDDMKEIFWRIRNNGHIPTDVQRRMVEKYGDSGLIDFLMIAGISRDDAYAMEEDFRNESSRRIVA
ncbi:TPA: hypothetical protein DEP34_03280 [Candidatus Uhrbacteria bacterium]|nr:hypothetical protein [Candidatus Uhrbacteria bacterium]HCB19383.1 hypothetical protein [Candidatus Uhrbacteria bacterium]